MISETNSSDKAAKEYLAQTEAESGHSDPWSIEAMPQELLNTPLDFLFAEHHRQRQAAMILYLIADGDFSQRGISELVEFLRTDFSRHVGDEELCFFPLLRQCCEPEDNIDALIKRLSDEHKEDEIITEEALKILQHLLDQQPLRENWAGRLRRFAEHIRQHLAVENAVLLPIARVRMDPISLGTLSELLQTRRTSA